MRKIEEKVSPAEAKQFLKRKGVRLINTFYFEDLPKRIIRLQFDDLSTLDYVHGSSLNNFIGFVASEWQEDNK